MTVSVRGHSTRSEPGEGLLGAGRGRAVPGESRANKDRRAHQERQAAAKAIELDEHSADAFALLGNIHLQQEWDFVAGERELRRSLDLDPGVSAHERWFAMVSSILGHHTPALAELQLGELVNPRSDTLRCEMGMLLYQIGRLDEALAKAQECLAITPAYATGYLVSGLALEQQGRLKGAIQAFERCVATNRNDLRCPAAIGHAQALAGEWADAQRIVRRIEDTPARPYSPQFLAAIVYAGLGRADDALRKLEAAYRDHEFDTPLMGTDPRFKPL